jgi:hypothetical protein
VRTHKVIAVVGASDEAVAHLRLLMRQAAATLSHAWQWGNEDIADLVVVNPKVLAGQVARNRVVSSGARCAVLIDSGQPRPDGLVLWRPFKLANVVDVLNLAALPTVDATQVSHQTESFYVDELDDDTESHVPESSVQRGIRVTPRARPAVAPGLDELIKGDPLAEPEPEPKVRLIGADTRIEATQRGARINARADDQAFAQLGRHAPRDATNALPPVKRADPASLGTRYPIGRYLTGAIIGGPAQLSLPGAPALTLDPKHREILANGSLDLLEAYAREPIAVSAWKALTSTELARVRAETRARGYEQLLWLEALLNSGGRLAGRLDPGGTYRLKRHVDVSPDYHHHHRIVGCMRTPARLHEIARGAGAAMEDVFDMVNAYDAIGAIEWQPRERLRAPSEPLPRGAPSLLGKLGWPFGKR